MRRLFFILLMAATSFCAVAQNIQYSCNGKYKLTLPSKLELQDSELNTVKQLSGKVPSVSIKSLSGHIIFQQKGLNSNVKAAFNKYVRVIIEYNEEDRKDPTYGIGDKIVVDRDLLYAVNELVEENCNTSNTPLIKIISVQSLTINGFPVLYYSYKRKGWEGKQPPVIVNVYRIFNRYESVILTFSYREAEREQWKDINKSIFGTFNFINRYK